MSNKLYYIEPTFKYINFGVFVIISYSYNINSSI